MNDEILTNDTGPGSVAGSGRVDADNIAGGSVQNVTVAQPPGNSWLEQSVYALGVRAERTDQHVTNLLDLMSSLREENAQTRQQNEALHHEIHGNGARGVFERLRSLEWWTRFNMTLGIITILIVVLHIATI
jgi:hypothetical protein